MPMEYEKEDRHEEKSTLFPAAVMAPPEMVTSTFISPPLPVPRAAGYDEVREYLDRHDLEPWGEYLEFFFMLYTGAAVFYR